MDPITLYECPVRLISEDTNKISDACFLVSESSIPFWPGGWVDQPSWLIEAFKIYMAENAKITQEKTPKPKK